MQPDESKQRPLTETNHDLAADIIAQLFSTNSASALNVEWLLDAVENRMRQEERE